MKSIKASWAVFILLGGLMWWLRYGGGLAGSNLDILMTYGPWLALLFHISLVLIAFKDSVFQGILCLLVPLYSFYWLFMVSDAFMLRALVAAIFIGIGQDSAAFYQEVANTTAENVRAWIASGG